MGRCSHVSDAIGWEGGRMFSYLHGWRRKTGCVVLVMAAVVMVGWNRSKSVGESVSFPSGLDTTDCFVSVDCSILWVKCEPGFFDGLLNFPHFEQHDFDPHSNFYHIFALRDVDWIWRLFGFGVGEVPAERGAHGRRFTFWIIPYWAVFVSLSLLSAYLLLWKQRSQLDQQLLAAQSGVSEVASPPSGDLP